ncbi:MAG: YihY/virulence factor BrkB family protein [Treponema sp.]|nr:YihY/virulence factor BrkB family protein [Treponema sp.]
MKIILKKINNKARLYLQRFFLTLQLHSDNSLANHAAACAYGFLLSIAPMLLLVAFFIFTLFNPSPSAIAAFFGNIPFLDGIFDEQWLSSDLFTKVNPGISGIISVISIIWAARILALSIQRGLKIVFPAARNRNPVSENLVMLVIEAVVIVLILIIILSSRTAMRFYRLLDFIVDNSFFQIITSQTSSFIFYIFILGLVSFFLYLFVPVKSPRKSSAFRGMLFFITSYSVVAIILGTILDISRYNFIYGALGNMIIILINVFIFFNFFFMGAQLAFVIDSFDALFIIKLRQINIKSRVNENPGKLKKQLKSLDIFAKLFSITDDGTNKNIRQYKKDKIIISQDDSGYDIFYLLEGEVDVMISSVKENSYSIGTLETGSFFGEMRHLISSDRCATVKAKTNVTVFIISPQVFDEMLKYDTCLDRDIIEQMSRRIKDITEQMKTGSNS